MPTLTEAHKAAIKKTWALVASDVAGNGVAIFLRLFKDYPRYLDFFPVFRNQKLEDLEDSPILRAHGSLVVFSLASVIDSIDDAECMSELWKKTLTNHIPRGVNQLEMYQHVFKTVLHVFSEKLTAIGAFDNLTKEAWVTATCVMLSQIKENLDVMKKQKA